MKHWLFGLCGVALGALGGVYGPSLIAHGQNLAQPYKGQDARQISSLSESDIEQLEKGAGWGLAKPAEFNGYPGPAHVLEFVEELGLSGEQKAAVEASFAAMQAKAKELGVALIDAEASLDEAFKSNAISPVVLAERLRVAEAARAALREVHLAAHLEVTPVLSDEQKEQYAELRGYGAGGHAGHGGH